MDKQRVEEIKNGDEFTKDEAEELAMSGIAGMRVVLHNHINRDREIIGNIEPPKPEELPEL